MGSSLAARREARLQLPDPARQAFAGGPTGAADMRGHEAERALPMVGPSDVADALVMAQPAAATAGAGGEGGGGAAPRVPAQPCNPGIRRGFYVMGSGVERCLTSPGCVACDRALVG